MTRAIIFDCFGVLTSDAWLPFKRRHFGHDSGLERQATDLNKQVDAGLIGFDDFVRGIAGLAGMSPEQTRHDIENNVANEHIFGYIRDELKPRYKIGMLSNAGDDWIEELFTPEQGALFDAVCLSYDTGYVKPHAAAYQTIAARLDVLPDECVFIDDQERYCTGARDVGMRAIHYRDDEQLRRELTAQLGG